MITSETHQFTVGSSSGCDLQISHPSVSRAHLKIYFSDDSVLIEDLSSTSGTFVLHNGEYKRVKSAKIKLETKVRLGEELEGVEIKKLIDDYLILKEKNKRDIAKRVKTVGLKRCPECGTVLSIDKIHCDCCGAIFDESA